MNHGDNTDIPKINDKERMDAVSFWQRHAKNLREKGLVSDEVIGWVGICTKPKCIGFDSMRGEVIRPGEIGKWDMFWMACQGGFSKQECLLMADITPSQLAAQEHLEMLEDSGFNPDDPDEITEFERLKNMTPDELDAEIIRLRNLLGVQG